MIRADYVVVGAGLSGAAIARTLRDAGRDVVVIERRAVPGGNCADALHHPTGLRHGLYGPHYFRTNSLRLWEWAQRFATFYTWAARVTTFINGEHHRWPLRTSDLHLFHIAVKGYNRKMWNTEDPPGEVKRRIEGRDDDTDERLKQDLYQGLPAAGYSAWIARMLEGIDTYCGYNYLWSRDGVEARIKLIYTGPVDAYFHYQHGRLDYRGQSRQLIWMPTLRKPLGPTAQVNYPEPEVPCLRHVEWNWLAAQPFWEKGTLLTLETPREPGSLSDDDYEYPYNNLTNSATAEKYKAMAAKEPKMLLLGRLAQYQYLDMDQAIAAAIHAGEKLIRERP